MKLLWYGETPFISTGASQVSAHLLPVFHEFFDEIHICAINQTWQEDNLPAWLTITQASQEDIWTSAEARKYIAACDYDVLFLTTDLNRISDLAAEIQVAKAAQKPIVMYAAMDTHIFQPSFWQVLKLADVPIVFSEWCARHAALMGIEARTIYHGCEPDVFYPLSIIERRLLRSQLFDIDSDETFLVLNVNRNQVRKDLARSMAAFHLFHLEHPDSLLYLHSKPQDLGGSLPAQAAVLGLSRQEIAFATGDLHESIGASRADLNRIYNCADVCISTSTGEGWGLTTTEAMAAGVPFIGPDNTVFPEILGAYTPDGWTGYTVANRGLLVESGGPDLWATFYGISDNPRALCSTTGMRGALKDVWNFPGMAAMRARAAREWTIAHRWEIVLDQWRDVLAGVVQHAAQKRLFARLNQQQYTH